ncbi:hypothetical protein D3C72_2506800 [compost metagenome]
MDFAQGRVNTNIGKGEVGYDKLAGVIERANVQYVFIEQEQFANSSLDSAACNYQFFQQFGWK